MTKYEWERELRKNIQRLPSDEVDKILDYYDELFEDKAERGMRESDIIYEFGNPFDVARKIMNEFDAENDGGKKTDRNGEGGDNCSDSKDDRPEFVKKFTKSITDAFNKVKNSFSGKKDEPAGHEDYDEDESTRDSSARFDKEPDGYRRDPFSRGGGSSDTIYHSEGRAQAKPEFEEKTPKKELKVKEKKSGCAGAFLKVLFFLPFLILQIVLWSVAVSLVAAGAACIIAGIAQSVAGVMQLGIAGVGIAKLGAGIAAAAIGALILTGAVAMCIGVGKMAKRYFAGKKNTAEA